MIDLSQKSEELLIIKRYLNFISHDYQSSEKIHLVDVNLLKIEQYLSEITDNILPVLYLPANSFDSDIVNLFLSRAHKIADKKIRQVVLSVDNDTLLQQLLSPRTTKLESFDESIALIVEIVKELKNIFAICGVSLCIEEWCPGGLSPSQGILCAQQLAQAGVDFIIATAGTKDFPILQSRKAAKDKQGRRDIADCQPIFPELMSSMWLNKYIKDIPIYAQGLFKDQEASTLESFIKQHNIAVDGVVHILTSV